MMTRMTTALSWTLQIGLAAMYFYAGFNKLMSDPMMVQFFSTLGLGQWFRYFTGTIEVVSAAALLVPRFAPLAALLLMAVMVGAVVSHFAVGGSPALPIALFFALGAVVYLRRGQLHVPAAVTSMQRH
jgi:putative oxidoreductase